MLTGRQAGWLLDSLCIRLGFCIPPAERQKLEAKPPADADAFTDAVFRAEGLDPSEDRHLYPQVRAAVERAFLHDDAGHLEI